MIKSKQEKQQCEQTNKPQRKSQLVAVISFGKMFSVQILGVAIEGEFSVTA